jgi:hypothetical protein
VPASVVTCDIIKRSVGSGFVTAFLYISFLLPPYLIKAGHNQAISYGNPVNVLPFSSHPLAVQLGSCARFAAHPSLAAAHRCLHAPASCPAPNGHGNLFACNGSGLVTLLSPRAIVVEM